MKWRRVWPKHCVNCSEPGKCICPYCLRVVAITALVVGVVSWMFK